MRDYAKVEPKMWHGATMKALRKCPEGVIVGMYLMSSPQSNMLGLFSQPVLYMAHETGLGIEGAMKGLKHCIDSGFCSFDEDSEFVWVYEMARYQVASELKANDLRCKGIQKDYDNLPDNPFLAGFFDRYGAAFHLTNKRGIQGSSQAPTKPLRSQEQEQEQEQDSPSLRSGEGADKPHAPRQKREQITLEAYLKACKAQGVKPIPDDHFVRADCRDAGISDEMLQVAWVVFRRRYTEDEKGKRKKYSDWPRHFANAVNERWGGIWIIDTETNQAKWSSTGLQQKAILDARARARETEAA